MVWFQALVLRCGLPLLYVLCLPFVWSDSGASTTWEFFEVPVGFARRLWLPTALLLLLVFVQVLWLEPGMERHGGPRPPADRVFRRRWNFWLFAAALALFVLRSGEHADIFPVHHMGETNSAILGARVVAEHGIFSAYNAGFGVLFSPFFDVLGPSFPVVRALTIVTWGVSIVAFLALFSALHGGANHPLVFVPPVFVAMILPSLRTYTWHAGAMLASVGAFFLAAAVGATGRTGLRSVCAVVGTAFYVAGFTAYQASAAYLGVVVLSATATLIVRRCRPDRIGWASLALVGLLVVSSATIIASAEAYPLADRLHDEWSDPRPNWSKSDNLLRSWDNVFYSFLWHDMSLPGSTVLLIGLAACLTSFRACVFARTSLVMFTAIFGAQAFLWGHADWSQNCSTIVPVLGLLVVGLRRLAGTLALAPRPVATVAGAAAMVWLASSEYRRYFDAGLFNDRQYEQQAYDTHIQLTLALRDARTLEADDVVFFMPALSGPPQPVSYETRGLEWKHPASRAVLGRMRYFTSPADLAAQVRRLHAESKARIRIYFGYPGEWARSELQPYLEHLPAGASVVLREPYRDVLYPHARLLVTYVDIRGG